MIKKAEALQGFDLYLKLFKSTILKGRIMLKENFLSFPLLTLNNVMPYTCTLRCN
jgi:hypothetical protein